MTKNKIITLKGKDRTLLNQPFLVNEEILDDGTFRLTKGFTDWTYEEIWTKEEAIEMLIKEISLYHNIDCYDETKGTLSISDKIKDINIDDKMIKKLEETYHLKVHTVNKSIEMELNNFTPIYTKAIVHYIGKIFVSSSAM